MEKGKLDPRLRLIQQAPMKGKTVLLRVDHNVVKKGQIKDPYRIDATIGTLYAIAAAGGETDPDDPCGETQRQKSRQHSMQRGGIRRTHR